MKKVFLSMMSIVFISSCSQGQESDESKSGNGSNTISGEVVNPQEKGLVLLQELQKNQMTTVDTVEINEDNTFSFEVKNTEPGFYRLSLYDAQYVNFILDDEDIKIKADGSAQDGIAEVEGSEDTEYFNKVNTIMQDFQTDVQALEASFQEANANGEQAKVDSLRELYIEMEKQKNEDIKNSISKMGNSIAALYAVNFLDAEKEFPFLDKLSGHFEENLPDSRYTQEFVERINNLRTLAVGQVAPDIALPNPAGDTVRLSSLRGKYVLVDFWAAWCRPCRMENPNVVRLYNQYKDKGFEVFGVSLDRSREDWVTAIEKDNLTWTHVSDLAYFNSAAAKLYNIQAIPATYLIGPDGKIIDKNLRGAALEEKLAEIM